MITNSARTGPSPARENARRSSGPRYGIGGSPAQRRADDAISIGPLKLPGRTMLTLMAAMVVLALTIVSLLIFVGRRPDPRIAASTDRLRNSLTY